jgi:hypothetical protein
MTGDQSRTLSVGDRVCWGATTMDLGTVTGTSWSEVTISWDDGEASSASHNDMARVERVSTKLIDNAYGDGEALLFLDSSGYVFYGDGSKKSDVRNWIDGRMRRITELLRRTDSIAVRNEFDPTKFE